MSSTHWNLSWDLCLSQFSYAGEFFTLEELPLPRESDTGASYWDSLDWETRQGLGGVQGLLAQRFDDFIDQMEAFKAHTSFRLESLEIEGGTDKAGNPEDFHLVLHPGDVVCVVGPTGSGKSRLLADIEALAQADTPTHRKIRINGKEPDEELRYSVEKKLVAQLSQNMNFVMDLGVEDFLMLHAESRLLENARTLARQVWEAAVGLAGEPFGLDTALTQLSGGQSRALMIADAALLSPKPIILIDEIENAGVDRIKALEFFKKEGKIVFLSTHDPLLALSGNLRLVIKGGAVVKVVQPDHEERKLVPRLEELDAWVSSLRMKLRVGESLREEVHGH